MKWFDKWFIKKSKWAWDNKHLLDEREVVQQTGRAIALDDDDHSVNDGLRISIKKVIGGSLVTFRTYDKKNDRNENKTYIITAEQDFNTELCKIITLESMRA